MAYEVPGRAEGVSPELVELWNEEVARVYESRKNLHTRFFTLDPDRLERSQVTADVAWPADPLAPTFCAARETVRELCDWGQRGRQALHEEYCEFAVVYRTDGDGRKRPKRVQVTTELREYWLTLATHDPGQLLAAAADVLGREPAWEDLYGVSDPQRRSPADRRVRFATTMAGHGKDPALVDTGVPRDPAGALNAENAVFMSHPINGLDDLLFIALFGARSFVVREPDGRLRRAERNDVVARQSSLACRHADPAVALATYAAVLAGRQIAFANPLGMYLRPFNHRVLRLGGEPIPSTWVRWSRGQAGMFQRLELGPADEDDAYLDDIEFEVGQARRRLDGGYQLLRMLEVGPLLATGATPPAGEDERERIAAAGPVDCVAGACEAVASLEGEYARAARSSRPSRTVSRPS